MFDPKKLLDDLLGSQIPGTESTVRDKAGQATQLGQGQSAGRRRARRRTPGYRHRPRGHRIGAEARRSRGHRRSRLQGLPELPGRQEAREPDASGRARAAAAAVRQRLPSRSRRRRASRRVHADAGPRHDRRRQGRRPYRRRRTPQDRRPAEPRRHRRRRRTLHARGTRAAARHRCAGRLGAAPRRSGSSSTRRRAWRSIPTRAPSAAISTCWPAGCSLPDALVDHVEATVSQAKGGNAAVPSRAPSPKSRRLGLVGPSRPFRIRMISLSFR